MYMKVLSVNLFLFIINGIECLPFNTRTIVSYNEGTREIESIDIPDGMDNKFLLGDDIQDQVKFYLYTRMNMDQDAYQVLVYNNASSVHTSYIKFNHPTTFIIHGYENSYSSDVNRLIKDGLLTREEHNVIVVDWSAFADTILYSNAADAVLPVGQWVSQFLQFLLTTGQSLDKVHLIGHSLGAHAVGLAGRNFSLSTGNKIPRITGLDPAKPGFDSADINNRIDVSDAEFVDCIHTNSEELGLGKPLCSVDFYPNGYKNFQPGCPSWDFGICSHGRSYEYYAESINLNHRFHGEKCPQVPADDDANCAKSSALMGDPASPQLTGYYLVITNDQFPYAQDIVNATQSFR